MCQLIVMINKQTNKQTNKKGEVRGGAVAEGSRGNGFKDKVEE